MVWLQFPGRGERSARAQRLRLSNAKALQGCGARLDQLVLPNELALRLAGEVRWAATEVLRHGRNPRRTDAY